MHDGGPLVARSCGSTVGSLFLARARVQPRRVAIEDAHRALTYAEVAQRTKRIAGALAARGVGRGDRVAILSENRLEFLELFLAAARLGAIVACQNWRLAPPELAHCLALVEPKVLFVSPRYEERPGHAGQPPFETIVLGDAWEALATGGPELPFEVDEELDPEDGFLVLYTSGTTGTPKGAVLSHRAEIARNLVLRAEFAIAPLDDTVAWSPLYHMGACEWSLGTLMTGGAVIVVDGFDKARIAEIVRDRVLGWLLLMPGMVGAFADELEQRGITAKGMRVCGVMADLVPPAEIARITRLLGAPYANTFGATETGCPPCSSNLIPVGVAPARLAKEVSPFCEVRLVDPDDQDVPEGQPGELLVRGPTLFSGYWRAPETNAQDFRGGWFHLGDVFVKNPDGTLDFVDRVKYLIKSGGENVYPAEIERVLLQDPAVADAAVVRKRDAKWGEIPIAFVAVKDGEPFDEAALLARCRRELAGYKQPKGIVRLDFADFPRSASGKVQRHELEKRLSETPS